MNGLPTVWHGFQDVNEYFIDVDFLGRNSFLSFLVFLLVTARPADLAPLHISYIQ
jgi:hypothetical protein